MIDERTYSADHILSLKSQYSRTDSSIIERAIYALGMVESLVKVGMPFIFKGGSCLMLMGDVVNATF